MALGSYPGVYIEEVPSGVKSITGVATSITAFIGRALRGPVNDPLRVQSYADFDRWFGGLWAESTLGYAVQQYFLNGGADAIIVRVHRDAVEATITLPSGPGGELLTLKAASPGLWGNSLQAVVDYQTKDKDAPLPDENLFNLFLEEVDAKTSAVRASEAFRNISRDVNAQRYVTKVLEQESNLVRVQGNVPSLRPDASILVANKPNPTGSNNDGQDGKTITDQQIADPSLEDKKEGLWALKKADLFNLLCIPPLERDTDVAASTVATALKYCKDSRAMLIVDPPSNWNEVSQVINSGTGLDSLSLQGDNATNGVIYFPRVRIADPLKENRLEDFAPCGVVAGVMARTDGKRGIWKAQGLEASLNGVKELTVLLTDGENGQLNPLGVNCLRNFPGTGSVVWGARTIRGADQLASEWKYVPVRRLALYIEESLYRGLKWVVFEPNDEPLWSQIRLNVGAFMHDLFRQGAFQGQTPKDAYFVKCDAETTTQNDRDLGRVNIWVGFAPLKPAEFVIIYLQQMAGQIQV